MECEFKEIQKSQELSFRHQGKNILGHSPFPWVWGWWKFIKHWIFPSLTNQKPPHSFLFKKSVQKVFVMFVHSFVTKIKWQLFLSLQVPHNIMIYKKSKGGNCSRGQFKGFLFNSYYTEVSMKVLLLSLDYSTLPFICTL